MRACLKCANSVRNTIEHKGAMDVRHDEVDDGEKAGGVAGSVRRVIAARMKDVLRAEVSGKGGSVEEVTARLLDHPAFAAAIEQLRLNTGAPGSTASDREHACPGNSEPRPKTVVWTFDSDDGGSDSASSRSGASWPRSHDGSLCEHEPGGQEPFDVWDVDRGDGASALQRLSMQLSSDSACRPHALQQLARHQASDVLCDQHWAALLSSLSACLLDGDSAVRRAATDELCRLFAAAVPGALAFDIASALGAACQQSLCHGIPVQELAGRVHFFTRTLVALSGSWEALSEEQSCAFVAVLCDVSTCAAPGASPTPSMMAFMALVDPEGAWVRGCLARLALRHAYLRECVHKGVLDGLLALLQAMPPLVQVWRAQHCESTAAGACSCLRLTGIDWRLLEVLFPTTLCPTLLLCARPDTSICEMPGAALAMANSCLPGLAWRCLA